MRTVSMSDMLHGRLVNHLIAQRKRINDAIRLIERNASNDWKGIPVRNRLEQEERLPRLRIEQGELTEYIETLCEVGTH